MVKMFFGENEYESYQDMQRYLIGLPKETNVIMVEADEVDDVNRILQSSSNFGLFSSSTITVCKRISKNKSKVLLDKFVEYITNQAEIDLVIWEDKGMNKKKTFYRQIKKHKVEMHEYKMLNKYELAKWVRLEARKRKIPLNDNQIGLIIELVGEDQFNLSNELNKLKLFYESNQNSIDTRDIKSIVSQSDKAVIWDLLKTIGTTDKKRRQVSLERLLQQGENPMWIFAMLAREFRILIQTRYLIDQGMSPSAIQKRLGLSPFVAQKSYKAAQGIGYQRLKHYHDKLISSDLAIKEGKLDVELALNIFVSI